jgi:hypothetical protein
MARIKDATKREVLEAITVSEYDTELTVRRQAGGDRYVTVTLADPKRTERESLRNFILGIPSDEESPLTTILAELDDRDAKATDTYGEKAPRRLTISLWLEQPTARALANVLGEETLDSTTTEGIRAQLNETTTKF